MNDFVLTFLVAGGIFVVSFMIGRVSKEVDNVLLQIQMIEYLAKNGYLKYQYDENGEMLLEKIDGQSTWSGQEEEKAD
jgi:hypothetical protein